MTGREPDHDDLKRWADGLRGASHDDLEAALLRQSVMSTAPQDDVLPTDPQADRAAAGKLLDRLRATRLLEPQASAPARRRGTWVREVPTWARWGVAVLLVATIGLPLVRWSYAPPEALTETGEPYTEPPRYRSEINIRRIVTAHPRQRAEALAAAVRKRGLLASIYSEDGRYVVDLEVSAANRDGLVGLPDLDGPLPDGLTRVDFASR